MQNIKNRKGLALSSALALVASLFSLPTAAGASETAVVVAPAQGTAAQTTVPHGQDFELYVRYGSGVANTSANWSFRYVVSSASAKVLVKAASDTGVPGTIIGGAASISSTVGEIQGLSSASDFVRFSLEDLTSISPAVSIAVTPYVDKDGTGTLTAGDLEGSSYTMNFVPWSQLGGALTLNAPVANTSSFQARATFTQGSVNWAQLDGVFSVLMDSTADDTTGNKGTYSAELPSSPAATPTTFNLSGSSIQTLNFSFSAIVKTSALTTSGTVQSVSATLVYVDTSSAVAPAALAATSNDVGNGSYLVKKTVAVAARTITGVTMSPVMGDNAIQTGANGTDARTNTTFTVNAFAHSTSETTSMAVATAVTVSAVGANIELDADSGVILNGTTYTTSAGLLSAGFTLAAGTTTFTIATFGQDNDGATETLQLAISSQLATDTHTFTFKVPSYTVAYVPTNVAGPAGTAKAFALTVKDNWNKLSARTDQRVAASVKLSGSTSTTVSSAVSNGAATVTVTPVPATRTGSATVTFTLQTYNQDTTQWDNGSKDTVAWNLYASATSDGFVSRTASVSTSISYLATSWEYSADIAVVVSNSFSDVVVSAPGLVIRDVDDTTATASDNLTIAATNQNVNVDFAGTIAGTYTVTFTSGTATTTSLVIIDAAGANMGTTITWDTTQIDSGRTKVVTGTLTDKFGNPVDTTVGTGSGVITLTYEATAGIVVGSLPTETDADGKFRTSVLTQAGDAGTLTMTATYKKNGAGTATSLLVTSVNAINIGASVVDDAAADKKVNAGSFKGYVAVYAKGYEGQRLSAKVGNDWVVVPALASNFVRVVEFTGAGYTIAVRIYIDRVLVDTITVTTK